MIYYFELAVKLVGSVATISATLLLVGGIVAASVLIFGSIWQ